MTDRDTSRFVWDDDSMPTIKKKPEVTHDAPYDPQWICMSCAHFNADVPPTCAAFPKGIPDEVRLGLNDHKKKIKGDGGLRYQQMTAKDKK